jgi:hypothetical protein
VVGAACGVVRLLETPNARPRSGEADGVCGTTQTQRMTLVAAILGSGVAMIDGSIVNVALAAIE